MTRRLAALLLLASAVGLHLGVTLPSRRQRDEYRREFASAREERERLRSRLAQSQRRAVRAPAGEAAVAGALRRSLLQATERLSVGAVEIDVEPGRRGAVAVHGRLSAEGSQADLLKVAGRLAEPSSGALLGRVALLSVRGGELRLEVEVLCLKAPADGTEGSPGRAPAEAADRPRRQVGT